MAQGDGAAVDVYLAHVKVQIPGNRHGLSGKSLVCLHQIHILDGQSGSGKELFGSGDGAHAHDGGIHAGQGSVDPGCHGFYSQFFGFFFAHDYNGGSAVVDGGGVSGGHHAVLLEGGTELGKALHRNALAGAFIGVEEYGFFFLLDFHRNDLIFEASGSNGRAGFLLAVGGKSVQFLTGQSPLLRYIFSGDAHVIVVESICKGVCDHGVVDLVIAHAVAETGVLQGVGSHGHVFDAAGYDDVSLALPDHSGGGIYAVQTGAAEHVDGDGRGFHGNAGIDSGLSGGILAGSGLDDTAHVDHVHLLRFYAGALQGLFDNDGSQFRGGGGA